MTAIILEIKQGKWAVNEKPLTNCSEEKKQLFLLHYRMKKFKKEVEQKIMHSFKGRAEEIKQKYNHKFN